MMYRVGIGTILIILSLYIYIATAQQAFILEPTDTEVIQGQTVTFLCSVSNKVGSLTWTKDDITPLNVDNNVIGGNRYALTGDQNNGEFNLEISDTVEADTGTYQCIVLSSGNDDSIESQIAVLTVINQQAFTVEPVSTLVFQGSTAVLTCSIANKQGSVQWLKDSVPISLDDTIISGASRFSIVGDTDIGNYNLQIVGANEVDGGSYQCSATATAEAAAISSTIALLTVETSGQRFAVIPSDVTTTEGSDVTFKCEVEDKVGTLSWLYNGQPISTDTETDLERHSIVGNQTEGVYNLVISEVEQSEAGTYHCILNALGSSDAASSSPASLIVLDAVAPVDEFPKCSKFPDTNLRENDEVILVCESEGGDPAAKLSWKVGQTFIDGSYVTEPEVRNTLQIHLTPELIGTEYSCRSKHPSYTTTKTCEIGALDFELDPTIEITINPTHQEIIENGAGSFECTATGDPVVLSYNWYLNGALINSSDSRFTIETTGTAKSILHLVSVEKSMDDALVKCEARNKYDRASMTSSLQVIEEESDLFKYVLAVLCLIAIVIAAAIIIGIIGAYCWRKQTKLNKVSPNDIENAITEEPTGAVAPDVPKKKRKHKKRHRGSKIIQHVIHAQKMGKGYDHNQYAARGDSLAIREAYDGYLSASGYPGYPMFSYSPEIIKTDRKYSYMNGSSKRGSYDVEGARKRTDSLSPNLPIAIDSQSQNVHLNTNNRRRSSESPDRRRSSTNPKISLSPGEYSKREEYERKTKELDDMRRSITEEDEQTPRNKHKKHKKHRKSKDAQVGR